MALRVHCDRCDKSAPTTIDDAAKPNLPDRWRLTTIKAPFRSGSPHIIPEVLLCPACDSSLTQWFRDGDPIAVSTASPSDGGGS
jgi:hypothetical protein